MKEKILIGVILVTLVLTAGAVFAKGPAGKGNGAFDEFGYNYKANMFNGRYCDYDREIGGDYCDVNLIMKWSDEWLNEDRVRCEGTSQQGSSACEGAWLTNHQSGTNEDGTKWTYFVKIVHPGDDASLLWDVSGDWVITVNDGTYPHDYTFTMTSLPDGTFTGIGGYPASSSDYTYDEIVTNGQIIGDAIFFTATYYQNEVPTGYTWQATGTIDSNGELSGTGTAGVYEWHSTSGNANKVWYTADGEEIGPVIWTAYARILQISNDPAYDEHGVLNNWEAPAGFGYYK